MKVAIIPARGGSVRLPRKNVRDFFGKPMLAYPIAAAHESNLFDMIIVSTDDKEIEEVAKKHGARVHRRREDDGSRGTQEVAGEVLRSISYCSVACVIYPTSPLLTWSMLQRGYYALGSNRFAMSVDQQGNDAGCYYFGWAAAFLAGTPLDAPHTVRVPLPEGRACDINSPDDWMVAEDLFNRLRRQHP